MGRVSSLASGGGEERGRRYRGLRGTVRIVGNIDIQLTRGGAGFSVQA